MDRIQLLFDGAARFQSPPGFATRGATCPAGPLGNPPHSGQKSAAHTESHRTKQQWASPQAYAHAHVIREPEQHTIKRTVADLVRNGPAENGCLSIIRVNGFYHQLRGCWTSPIPSSQPGCAKPKCSCPYGDSTTNRVFGERATRPGLAAAA